MGRLYLFICVAIFVVSCGYVNGIPVDINKEVVDSAHMGGENIGEINRKFKRSTDDLNSLLNEVAAQDDFYNAPPRSLNKEKLPNSALLQYLLIRKPSLIHLIQEKRSLDYSPRLGRSSTSSDDDEKPPQKSNAYYDNQFYAPRLGKKSLEFSPRLGRSVYSDQSV